MSETTLTPEQILAKANELARELYEIRGYGVPDGYKFHQARHPHEREAWRGACAAMELLIDIDPEDVLIELEE